VHTMPYRNKAGAFGKTESKRPVRRPEPQPPSGRFVRSTMCQLPHAGAHIHEGRSKTRPFVRTPMVLLGDQRLRFEKAVEDLRAYVETNANVAETQSTANSVLQMPKQPSGELFLSIQPWKALASILRSFVGPPDKTINPSKPIGERSRSRLVADAARQRPLPVPKSAIRLDDAAASSPGPVG
jgi:hypothetical protein